MAKEKIQEDETKNVLKAKYFGEYDWTRVVAKIDLIVRSQPSLGCLPTNYLWAETKQGNKKDIYESFIQLILTIGRWRIYEQEMPPYFLGAADAEKIAFVEYNKVMQIFSKTDFNWNVTPSDHSSKEFRELYALLHDDLVNDVRIYKYAYDEKLIRAFIKKNFKEGRKDVRKQPVTKNNFTFVYYDWVKSVKDSIAVDWQTMKAAGVMDRDFFLADLMSKDGLSIKENLKVVLERTKYKVAVKVDFGGIFDDAFREFGFKDDQVAYNQFWNRYERPPKAVYQRYILERADLLVPQDIREVKGSYYTPEQWVRLSQEYISRVLGEDWQEEYYVWDCAAGTGNLLRGLSNKYNVYASTLDDSDVKIMHDAIDGGRLNLVGENVFQFDFLNDGYREENGRIVPDLINCKKIPESLRKIIADPEKRKKLVVYINAPYKEATNGRTSAGTGKNNTGATNGSLTWSLYGKLIGAAINELFAQFSIRIAKELPGCWLAEFSKLKILQAPNFKEFRKVMNMDLRSLFLVPGETFDNVSGQFPIGFQIYKTGEECSFDEYVADVYVLKNKEPYFVGEKTVICYDNRHLINSWAGPELRKNSQQIGWIKMQGNDFQNNNYINIYSAKPVSHNVVVLVVDGLLASVVYHAIRHIPQSSWLNDRDQFLAPNDSWAGDLKFQVDCLIWSIFNNNVHAENGICHWIPFYESDVNSPASFNSRFMADFLHGKIKRKAQDNLGGLFELVEAETAAETRPLDALSEEARAVLDAGREIWRYYMTKPGINANASFLDIRAFFQGFKTTEKGKRMMNSASADQQYMELLTDLRQKLKMLEVRIEPKIYEHGFLLR